jgi:hypothetical protein
MKATRKTLIGIAMLCLPLPLLLVFCIIEKHLLSSGFLNTRDLGFVGGQSGTLSEYLTNVWHWDAFGGILMLIVPIGLATGSFLIWKGRRKGTTQHASAP